MLFDVSSLAFRGFPTFDPFTSLVVLLLMVGAFLRRAPRVVRASIIQQILLRSSARQTIRCRPLLAQTTQQLLAVFLLQRWRELISQFRIGHGIP